MKSSVFFASLLASVCLAASSAHGQGTAFNYQGHVVSAGSAASGTYDLRFTIYDSTNVPGNIIVGPLTNPATPVSDGLFSAVLDFGTGVFTGPSRWLQIDIRTNGAATFTGLTPRQPILAVPYAVLASTASNLSGTLPTTQLVGFLAATQLSGTVSLTQLPTAVVTNGASNLALGGAFTGNAAGLTNTPGTLVWVPVTGTNQQAQSNFGYLATNSTRVTITLPGAPNLGDLVGVSGAGAGGWLITQNASQLIEAAEFGAAVATNWNTLANWTQSSAPDQQWEAIASSADGTRLAAGASGGGIYTSTDSGRSWVQTSAPIENWRAIGSSADGRKLAAAGNGSGIYTSSNSGATWTQTSAPGSSWFALASSADGALLAAAAFGGAIFISTNSGTTWTQSSAPSSERWISIAASANGSKLAAAVNVGVGGIYASSDSGKTWVLTSAPGSTGWEGIASSADGSKLAATVNNSGISMSTNSGNTWTATGAPNEIWGPIACSSDASILAAAVGQGGGLYISTNSGVTWIQSSAPSAFWTYWSSIASSSNGAKLVAAYPSVAGSPGAIWVAQASIQATTSPGAAGFLTGGQNSSIILQYVGNGNWQPLSYSGGILSDTSPTLRAAMSASSGGFSSANTSFSDVTNLSVTTVTTGPVCVGLIADGSTNASCLGVKTASGAASGQVAMLRDGTTISKSKIYTSALEVLLPPSGVNAIDFPVPGPHLYSLQVKADGSSTIYVSNAVLVVHPR